MLEALDSLGRASVELLWLPVLVWTALWLASEVASRFLRAHPLPQYRATQAMLLALPLGAALAPFVDPAVFAPGLNDPIVVTVSADAVPLTEPPAAVPAALPALPPLTPWMLLGLGVISCGLFGLVRLARLAGHAVAIHRLRRALPPPDRGALATEAVQVGRSLGLHRRVSVVQTDAAVVPMTFGVWRPVVVLPASLSGEECRLALAHELLHVRRRDALSAWLEALILAAFAAHPGVHRLAARCELLRELACDATLLARPNVRRSAYAALVSAFVLPTNAPRLRAAVGMAATPSHVHQRLAAMTHPLPLLRRSTVILGWALAFLVLIGASLTVTASRALAQEKRVIIRTIESAGEPIVVVVDGERQEEGVDAINELDVHSVNVLEGEDARARFGEDHVIEIITREEARARGLPEHDDAIRSFSFSVDDSGERSGLNVFRSSGNEFFSDSLKGMIQRLHEGTEPLMLRLREGMEPSVFKFRDGSEPMILELKEGMEPLMRRLRERMESGEIRLRDGLVDSLRLRLIHPGEHIGSGVIRERIDGEGGTRFLRLSPGLDLETLTDIDPDFLQSVEVTRVNGQGHVVLRLKNGEIREFDLNGDARGDNEFSFGPETSSEADRSPFAGVRAQPNPATREVIVSYELAEPADVRLRVYDIEGRLVADLQRRAQMGRQSIEVDVTHLAPGAYVYRLETPGAPNATGRFTVAR